MGTWRGLSFGLSLVLVAGPAIAQAPAGKAPPPAETAQKAKKSPAA